MARVLIIDDDEMVCGMLSAMFRQLEHETSYALTLADGLTQAKDGDFDVVFLDVRMPDGSGLDWLPDIRQTPSEPEVIIMTGAGDPDGAELAIKSGAWDYLEKSFSTTEEMKLPLARALQYRRDKMVKSSPKALKRGGIVGESQIILDCLDLVSQAAGSDTSVLITGETGTGKELFARAIHDNSRRADKTLVVVDCTALPETLVESLLFGHERGSFTGAERTQEGLIKQADGGTLFLDEVGELPMPVQKSFLRVLQERRFRPIGGTKETNVDFRLVAATNRDLEKMAEEGEFRQDLLFRLRSFAINLPPLRRHREDIHELMVHHLSKLCQRYNIATKGFSPEVLEAFSSYEWPGNIREMVNALERALAAAWHEPTLFSKHLPQEIRIKLLRRSIQREQEDADTATQRVSSKPILSWKETRDAGLDKLEYEYLRDLMAHTKGDVAAALDISGLKRSRLYQLLKKHGLNARS